jgi:hypothetical protein
MPTNTTPIKMPLPSRRTIISDGSGDSHHHQTQPPLQQCKPIILLASFLLYLNFSLLGHLTAHPRNYYQEWFPDTMVVGGVRRSETYEGDDVIAEGGQQSQVNKNNDLDKNRNQKDEPQQQQEEEEEQNRQWELERPTPMSKRDKEKKVPASFYRSEKSMVDVNAWWKTMEQKIQLRQNKQKTQQNNNSGNIIDDNNNNESSKDKRGKIALIMSYPNSGTSYTSKLVRQASQTTTATNYGMEGLISATDYKSVPVYNYSLEGPYWLHPPINSVDDGSEIEGEDKQQTKRDVLPPPPSSASILTKTHCGIRCTHCPPLMYVENEETFYQRCLSGARKVPDRSKTNKNISSGVEKNHYYYKKEFVTYSPNLIHSAIHLIRNPFDNAISRFHHELKEHAKYPTKYQSWMDRYPRNSLGFRRWCNDENTMYGQYEQMEGFNWSEYGYSSDIINYFEGVSCHAEMVRYALWHALALRTVEKLDVPVLYVYYEDYANDLEGETNKLLSFLNLTRSVDEETGNQVELPEFRQSDYSDYFTLEERAATSELIRRVMKNEKGIELLSRYFTEWDFQKLINQTQDII